MDLDDDGLLDLVVGVGDGPLEEPDSGKLVYYRNVGTQSRPSFEKVDVESPFEGLGVGENSAPTFADVDGDGDEDLVVGDKRGRLSYFQNTESCRKTGEAGACSGNGVCGTYEGGQATCKCLFTFEGAQCDACRAGNNGTDCQNCPGNTWSKPGVRKTCDECFLGFYRDGDTCVACGEDKVCETTDVTLDNFECIAGTYRDGDECKSCENGMLVALFGTQIYSWTRPFPEDAGDRLAETAQWSTFFTFLAALMILLNVEADSSFHREVFAVLLVAIQFMPLVIGPLSLFSTPKERRNPRQQLY